MGKLSPVLGGAVLLLATAAFSAPAAADVTDAQARCVERSGRHADNTIGEITDGGTPIRTGPYSDCRVIWRTTSAEQRAQYHCYAFNDVENDWTYLTVGAYTGWVYSGNLYGGGSYVPCDTRITGPAPRG
ncbi:hypothetical protein ABNF97_24730 [Plantactinospora sp. B6F1]|uniref:hypothetical protein n=1 Tax=Plantactinospora sp. B6F1 TaxID=3158971 RepID=UPI0032D8B98D